MRPRHARVDLQALRNWWPTTRSTRRADLRRRCQHLAALRRRDQPGAGFYYHPPAIGGQPIVAGWAFQWIFSSASPGQWTAPIDAAGCPARQPNKAAVSQSARSSNPPPASDQRCPVVFDAGYDPAPSASAWRGARRDLGPLLSGAVLRRPANACSGRQGRRPRRHGASLTPQPGQWPVRPLATPKTRPIRHRDRAGGAGLHPSSSCPHPWDQAARRRARHSGPCAGPRIPARPARRSAVAGWAALAS